MYVVFCFLAFGCQYQCNRLPGKSYFWTDVLCVEWSGKLYSVTRSLNPLLWHCLWHWLMTCWFAYNSKPYLTVEH